MEKIGSLKKMKCPICGSKSFKQEIVETYYRYIDEKGQVTEYEDDFTHALEFRPIRCANCDTECDDLFEDVEIE
jgi:hypothetical protein